jgi:two-component system, OmpR family, sensor histidine kinase KdpD
MNDTTGALALLLVVLVVAAVSSRRVAIVTSIVAFACYNYFFLPPTGTLTITNGDDAVALFALLGVSLIGSHLSHQARSKAAEAVALVHERNEADMARRSAEAKSALVASLSHELKTPLTALTIAAGNLDGQGLSDDERREQMHLVQTELDKLKRLFDHVIELASLETRAVSAELEWVHPSEIIDAARQQTGSALAARQVRVNDDDRGLVQIDPRLTSAALTHVFENAAVYSPPPAPIDVDIRVANDELAVAVRDHGSGLPPEDLERVFERFYRGTRPRDRFGSGMGLAIARGLLAVQGGRITATNHPDGGAIFTLVIPVVTRAGDLEEA